MDRRRALAAALAAYLIALLAAAGSASAAETTVGGTEGTPNYSGCSSDCTYAGAQSVVSGTVVQFRLRHGGSATSRRVAFKVLDASGYVVRRTSEGFTLPAGPAGEFTANVNLPIAAGQHIGVFVEGGGLDLVDLGGSGSMAHVDGEPAADEPATGWSSLLAPLLLAATVEVPDGGGSSSGGSSGGGSSGGGSDEPLSCTPRSGRASVADSGQARTASRRLRLDGTMTAARGWRATVLHRGDNYAGDDTDVAFDRRGRAHVVGVGLSGEGPFYAGPHGRKLIERVGVVSGDVDLAVSRSGLPVVGYGKTALGITGTCDVFRMAEGSAFTPYSFAATGENGRGFFRLGIALDQSPRDPGRLHTAYRLGQDDRLVYQWGGGQPEALPVSGVTGIVVAADRGSVAVAAATQRRLEVLVRRGDSGRWRRTTIVKGSFGDWDMALGPDGRPRVAVAAGRPRTARVYNGKRLVRTRLYADQVALAVDGKRNLHVAFTKTGGPNCFGFVSRQTCVSNGLLYVRANPSASRGRVERVQHGIGDSPGISIAASGRRVAVAYGDPANSGALTLRGR